MSEYMHRNEVISRLKRLTGLEAEGSTCPYVCRACESTFDVQYHVCPDCGGYSVEMRLD